MNSKLKFLITISFFLISSQADNFDQIDLCIQSKLNLPEPISHQTIQNDIATKGGKFRHAARAALQICHPTFDIVAGQIYRKMAAPNAEISEVEVKCFEVELIRKNSEGLLVEKFDKNLLNGFEGDENCEKMIKDFKELQVNLKMPDGTAEERQCLMNSIDKYVSGRFKAKILARGQFSIEIFNDEKERFVRELREVSDEMIKCLVE